VVNLQTAIYSRLVSELSVPVYDAVPQAVDAGDNSAFPYVTVGDDSSTEFDTDTSIGFDTDCTIHVWSRYRGRREVKQIQKAIYDALHLHDLTVTGYHTVMVLFQSADSFMDADGITRHGVSIFRIVTEDV
jgi:hypothetical protein